VSYSAFLTACRQRLGQAHVLTGADCAPYCTDWRGRYHGPALAVLCPESTAEVAALVCACKEHGVAIVPQGGNTGLVGGATPLQAGPLSVVLSLRRLNRIRALDPVNDTIVAEAGCTLHAVQEAARKADRLFAVSLASEGSCTVGGAISTNAGGVHVLRYGTMRAQVLGLEVVLPDGEIWDGLRALRKDNTGYDLKQLFIGAEGSLGLVTAAVLRLEPRPVEKQVMWVALASLTEVLSLFERARHRFGPLLTAFELMCAESMALVTRHMNGLCPPLPPSPWSVLMELSARHPNPAHEATLCAFMEEAEKERLFSDAVLATSLAQMERLWALRESISEAQKREGLSLKHDIAVPLSVLPVFLEAMPCRLQARWPGLREVIFGHVGDGNLHYNLSFADPDRNANFIHGEAAFEATGLIHEEVMAHHGSISAEHGLGQLKSVENTRYKSPVEMRLMRQIKAALDPENRMNPGKLLPF
jgi:FAD/FMN-containing dehydrogenase